MEHSGAKARGAAQRNGPAVASACGQPGTSLLAICLPTPHRSPLGSVETRTPVPGCRGGKPRCCAVLATGRPGDNLKHAHNGTEPREGSKLAGLEWFLAIWERAVDFGPNTLEHFGMVAEEVYQTGHRARGRVVA